MRSKLLNQLFIFCLLFFTLLAVRDLSYRPAAGVTNQIPRFPSLQIKMLSSPNAAWRRDALQETGKALLRHLNTAWLDYNWQARSLFLNLLPGNTEEVIIVITIPGGGNLLAVLQEQGGPYFLIGSRSSPHTLVQIDKLPFLFRQDLLLTVEEYCAVRPDKEWQKSVLTLWSWQNGGLAEVWSGETYRTEIWLEEGDSRHKQPAWLKLHQEAEITLSEEPQPRLDFRTSQSFYQAPFSTAPPGEPEFLLLKYRSRTEHFTWNDSWHRFIMQTGRLRMSREEHKEVAVLRDLEYCLENLVGNNIHYYQILDRDNEIYIAEKRYVQLDP